MDKPLLMSDDPVGHDLVGRNHLLGYTATMLRLHIAIAGCGPCGLAAALLLLDRDSDLQAGIFLVEAA